jgi:hypothetical protein
MLLKAFSHATRALQSTVIRQAVAAAKSVADLP